MEQRVKDRETQDRAGRKYGWKCYLMEAGVLILGTAGAWLMGGIREKEVDRLLGNCCMVLFGLALTGFLFRREYLNDSLDYDNGEHPIRFWICVYIGLAAALACGFLPVGGWPFLVVFLMLALFSNMGTGIVAASMLLLISVVVSGCGVGGYVLYLVSGVFAIVMFRHLQSDFKVVFPLSLSILCLLVCETANIILVANTRPGVESFVIPAANMIVSSILILGCIKLFAARVVYRYREKYLELNDTGNPVLVDMKQQNREAYLHSIHTAYFCERIAVKLGLDADALKCAGYYCHMGDGLEEFMAEKNFPPAVREILTEYATGRRRPVRKETAVLICADRILTAVLARQKETPDGTPDYDRVIDGVFGEFHEAGTFHRCNITMGEMYIMQKVFREEKLYYDFLR